MSKKMILAAAALIGAALCLNAQTFQEGFFLRGYNRAYQYNPAIVGDNDFIGGVQWNYGLQNNVGVGAFLYPTEDGLVTAFHSSIPAETFLGNLPDLSRFQGEFNAGLISYGFWKANAFHTFDISVRGNFGFSLPANLFGFIKQGAVTTKTDLSGTSAGGNLFIELAYGYGRKLNDWLSIGGRAKLLLPMYGVNYDVSQMDLTTREDKLELQLRGDLYLTNRSGTMHTNDQGYWDLTKMTSKDKLGWPSGCGAALDLGLLATPAEGLTISLSLLDFGAIYWYYGNRASVGGTATFEGLDVMYEQLNGDDLKDMLLADGKDFLSLMRPIGYYGDNWRFQKMNLNANLGVKYEMPFYRRLAVGATGRYIGSQGMPYWEGRGALEINPVDWLDITANLGGGTQGMVFGLAASVKFHRFNLTAGWEDGFGGTLRYWRIPVQRNFRTLVVGISYNL